ncbi:heavy-metal-associated domain-containing protein [Streptomyces sudanensis]|uniref:heavy-metal-associated domain-containing protein n=1 Tax=Streptomyces sudanensis TaxID=436397 RepID=UPI0020CE8F36|nr:heavy-metal-associated domain-containing protein [Streptomyces sudanensis]MCP9988880.1 heavy-metal-associated domain-containing protein [Streptomyces sudanensis]
MGYQALRLENHMSSSCCSPNNTCSTSAPAGADGVRTVYTVTGMTCGHCKDAITKALGSVDGVSSVEVDLASGLVTVVGADPDDRVIAAAVEGAGYEVTGRAA